MSVGSRKLMRGVAVLGVVAAACVPLVLEAAPMPAPHKAVYDMELASASPAMGILAVQGELSFTFTDTCDGWAMENKTVLDIVFREGGVMSTTWDLLTWESRDGLSYRFRVRSTRGGEVVESIEGVAGLPAPGEAGEARYVEPEEMVLDLPPGTMFPTAHALELIERSRAGKRVFSRVIFDGSDTDGPMEVNALISPAERDAPELDSPLLDVPSWRYHLAFFPLVGQAETPVYEVSLRYHENGVARDILQQFEGFSLKGNLRSIEALPDPGC